MRSDDLVPLLAPSPGPAMGYRQGVIVSWNPDNAENTVLVGGTLMTNLNCLNTSEASILAEGDVVGILTTPGSWAILGRLTIPGTPEAVSSIQAITNRIQASNDPFAGTRNTNTWGDLTGVAAGPSVSVRVGSSGRVLALWSCELGQTLSAASGGVLTWQTKNTPHVGVQVSGASSVSPDDVHALNLHLEFPAVGQPNAAQALNWVQASMMHLYTGLTPGDTTFTLKYRHDGLSPANHSAFGAREIAVFAL
jgi:hypothetical protein